MWNRYIMLEVVFADVPWNALSNLELQWSQNSFFSNLVQPSATTFSNIRWKEYALSVDAIKMPLPS
jgi:hypothetical protein